MRLLTLLLLVLAAPLALAQAPEKYVAGTHYHLIEPAQPTANPNKIEVIESFSYGCIHCAHFQPNVEAWKKKLPADVSFALLPAFFQPYFALMGRAYYAAEALGVVEASHAAMFKAVFDEKRQMRTIEEIAEFYKAYGVKPEDFVAAAKSFAVEAKVKRADDLTKRYGVDGTPDFIVNGKYRVGPRSAGGYDKIFDVVDFLIAKERAAKKS
jgi:protein dithiol oxidoreductase (disulfide-forming)